MCPGLLPSRRHIEKREDPGDEVAFHPISQLLSLAMPPRLKSAPIRDIGAQYSACLQIHIPKLYENEFKKKTVNVVKKSIV